MVATRVCIGGMPLRHVSQDWTSDRLDLKINLNLTNIIITAAEHLTVNPISAMGYQADQDIVDNNPGNFFHICKSTFLTWKHINLKHRINNIARSNYLYTCVRWNIVPLPQLAPDTRKKGPREETKNPRKLSPAKEKRSCEPRIFIRGFQK